MSGRTRAVVGAAAAAVILGSIGVAEASATHDVAAVRPAWSIESTAADTTTLSSELAAVSCASPDTCVAVGSQFDTPDARRVLIEMRDRRGWTLARPAEPTTGSAGELVSVSCPTAQLCVAVGDTPGARHDDGLAETSGGGPWSAAALPPLATGADLEAVSCSSAIACTAVGRADTPAGPRAIALRFDGATWRSMDTLGATLGSDVSEELTGVSCPSDRSCTAVGHAVDGPGGSRALAERWDGTAWHRLVALGTGAFPGDSTASTALTAVSCPSTTSCVVVGNRVAADGSTGDLAAEMRGERSPLQWSVQTPPGPPGARVALLRAVSCRAPDSCVAVGTANAVVGRSSPQIEDWDGGHWSTAPAATTAWPDATTLVGVSGAPGAPGTPVSVGAVADRTLVEVATARR